MASLAEAIMYFYKDLRPSFTLPAGVTIMNPFADTGASALASQFYTKYYNDNRPRTFIYGINPGRFGGGVTGIPFTDPVRLSSDCGINHQLPMKSELSSVFIYEMIKAFGGPKQFYNRYLLTAVCPLGFTLEGKNLNYYDSKELLQSAEKFIVASLKKQASLTTQKSVAYCLGEDKNFRYFSEFNKQAELYKEIIRLPHPRWIMQYRRKNINQYIKQYIDAFT
jgi:hypothetical protein